MMRDKHRQTCHNSECRIPRFGDAKYCVCGRKWPIRLRNVELMLDTMTLDGVFEHFTGMVKK